MSDANEQKGLESLSCLQGLPDCVERNSLSVDKRISPIIMWRKEVHDLNDSLLFVSSQPDPILERSPFALIGA